VIWIKDGNDEGIYEMGVEFLHDSKTMASLIKHVYGRRKASYTGKGPKRGKRHSVRKIEVI
jgi:hypothetical protein